MQTGNFQSRHNGPREYELKQMLDVIGVSSLDELIEQTVPQHIRLKKPLKLKKGVSEYDYFMRMKKIAGKNKLFKTYIGQGYYNTATPAVIQRNILENPSWYTSYTPYQAEISQGRLEALLNFQTMVIDLTGMEIANASLLDEGTAAAEAMIMFFNARSRAAIKNGVNQFFVDTNVFSHTIELLYGRAESLGIEVIVGDYKTAEITEKMYGALVQYPNSQGEICDYKAFAEKLHAKEASLAVAADLLSLAILTPPAEWGADVVLGTTQRFGVPMGFGGPHAGYFATRDSMKRNMPGRIIGISKDATGNPALRMALQTREQHIKREKATSNICTAQALLANMAGMYAVYHGAEGLRAISTEIHAKTGMLATELNALGYTVETKNYFDTIRVKLAANVSMEQIEELALKSKINLLYVNDNTVGISIDETVNKTDLSKLLSVFSLPINESVYTVSSFVNELYFDAKFKRTSEFLTAPVFNAYRSETELMRYIKKLERKDFSLTHSMISLGSCTMKLNAAVEMLPVSWPELNSLHPFVPEEQAQGYHQLFAELEHDLCEITGFNAVSLQPNSGSAGEYAGLAVIAAYHKSRGQGHRNLVLIPSSAHGTNPASAVMAGADIVIVECDALGNINVEDLRKKAELHKDNLMGFMVTYPSTHGVFEDSITEMCKIIHEFGGQVYMDGANMNAQVGLTNPANIGADVCHLNLHKTFAIPHGGGGPGVGPIAVAEHLAQFLPGHNVVITGGLKAINAVASAPWGSASVLVISHAYIKLLGSEGLTNATKYAILNANYLAASLKNEYSILYTGKNGRVAHEMILDCRNFKPMSGISETDIAKRLMDYGFHAPTLSFPVHGTLMIEPTESESLQELNRFVSAMKAIRAEIDEVAAGKAEKEDNVLKNAPHTNVEVCSSDWNHAYTREKAAFPLQYIAENKFWPSVKRLDDAYGDRNLVCACLPVEAYK